MVDSPKISPPGWIFDFFRFSTRRHPQLRLKKYVFPPKVIKNHWIWYPRWSRYVDLVESFFMQCLTSPETFWVSRLSPNTVQFKISSRKSSSFIWPHGESHVKWVGCGILLHPPPHWGLRSIPEPKKWTPKFSIGGKLSGCTFLGVVSVFFVHWLKIKRERHDCVLGA